MICFVVAVASGVVVGGTVYALIRQSGNVYRLASEGASPAEALREGLLAGRYGQLDEPEPPTVETEILTGQGLGTVALQTHADSAAAIQFLSLHPAFMAGEFRQIVLTRIEES